MFRDYAERGRAFKEEVRRLARERRATREQWAVVSQFAAIESWPLGTQAAPVCEARVPTPSWLMTADCSRAASLR